MPRQHTMDNNTAKITKSLYNSKSLGRLKATIKTLCNYPGGNKVDEYDLIITSQF